MPDFFDELETRSSDVRAEDLAKALPSQIARAQRLLGYAEHLGAVLPETIDSRAALAKLPLLRKADLAARQALAPPFGGLTARSTQEFTYVFQSPGPIYEPGRDAPDWWRMARFLHASSVTPQDVIQNCFAYHLTPAGIMFENGAKAIGATICPAGTGQTEWQVRLAEAAGATAYAGTPDYFKVILDKAAEMGIKLKFSKAVVGGGALFPSLREAYATQGIICRQCYATADLGNIAYESEALEGLIVDEGVIVEIVTPGTGDPVAEGEVGEVVVTSLNEDYPLIRFATGDLSAVLPGQSPCGRSNMRIKGWMGRADQTTKVKGMFIRPEQVAAQVAAEGNITRARVIVTRRGEADVMQVKIETTDQNAAHYADLVKNHLKLAADIETLPPGGLPRDGIIIEDQRQYDP